MKYLIGITSSTHKLQNVINNAYIKAFSTKTTTPIIIPNLFENQNEIITTKEQEDLEKHVLKIVNSCDALVLSGGKDLNPILSGSKLTDSEEFNTNRDILEKELIRAFLTQNKPVLGICRGFQILGNIFKLNYFQQDISITTEIHDGLESEISNRKEPIHSVHLFGKLKEYFKTQGLNLIDDSIITNSWHHQGFTLLPEGGKIKNKDLESFITEKLSYTKTKDSYELCPKDHKTKINNFNNLEIIMATNNVIEGFQHKTLPIIAFQNHPEEYTNSIAINYFIEKFLK